QDELTEDKAPPVRNAGERTPRWRAPRRSPRFPPMRALPVGPPQPPFALQATEKSVSLMDRGHDVGMAGMHQRPALLASQPAMLARELLHVARVEASPHRRRAVPPRVGQEPLEHAVERALPGGDLEDLTDFARAHVVEIPPDQPPLAVQHGTRAQRSKTRLAGRLLE